MTPEDRARDRHVIRLLQARLDGLQLETPDGQILFDGLMPSPDCRIRPATYWSDPVKLPVTDPTKIRINANGTVQYLIEER